VSNVPPKGLLSSSIVWRRASVPFALLRFARTVVLIAALPAWGTGQTNKAEIAGHASRAQAAIQANHADVAVRELEALLRLDPGNVNARASLGMVAFTQGDYRRAAEQFKAALTLSPTLWSAKAFLGMCQIRLGLVSQGQESIEASLKHVEDNVLRNQAGLELIRTYSESGEIEKAVPVIKALRDRDPGNEDVLYSAYRVYSALAAAALQKLSTDGHDSARVHEILGQSMMAQERYSEAIQEYSKAIERNGRLAGLHLQLGQAILAASRTEENRQKAAAEFQTELEINPGDAEAAYQLGEIFYERSDWDKAKRWLLQAVELRPKFAEAQAALGRVLAQQGDQAGAIQHLEIAVAEAPDNAMAHYHLAQLYRKAGRANDADREFDRFRKLSASNKTPNR
jgi:tetratricopeptide (TPR) repeat protein